MRKRNGHFRNKTQGTRYNNHNYNLTFLCLPAFFEPPSEVLSFLLFARFDSKITGLVTHRLTTANGASMFKSRLLMYFRRTYVLLYFQPSSLFTGDSLSSSSLPFNSLLSSLSHSSLDPVAQKR